MGVASEIGAAKICAAYSTHIEVPVERQATFKVVPTPGHPLQPGIVLRGEAETRLNRKSPPYFLVFTRKHENAVMFALNVEGLAIVNRQDRYRQNWSLLPPTDFGNTKGPSPTVQSHPEPASDIAAAACAVEWLARKMSVKMLLSSFKYEVP